MILETPRVNEETTALVLLAREALRKGDRPTARKWARDAATKNPEQEDAWLLLAALGSPRASLTYLQKALEINPASNHARKGMHWAIKRYRNSLIENTVKPKIFQQAVTPNALIRNTTSSFQWVIILTILILSFFNYFVKSASIFDNTPKKNAISFNEVRLLKASATPTPTSTSTSTPTPTITPSLTPSLTPTFTETPQPTNTPPPPEKKDDSSRVSLPYGVSKGENWIDVNLTNQRVYAFQGKNLLKSFIVSTGTWQHPTVVGQYRIYVKYTYANMAGPGYFLPNVPYVMYFYKGYGIHGTYWHNNFGVPMSHGCINLRTEDAGWIFNWASVGTMVNIHY